MIGISLFGGQSEVINNYKNGKSYRFIPINNDKKIKFLLKMFHI